MKNYLLLFAVFLFAAALPVTAKTYYVAANGSNSNAGTSINAPWQTIAKVNASFTSIVAGDSILFRRGDTFWGALVVGKSGASGKPIVFGAYGTGAKPVITGFVNPTVWSLVSTGIYQASVPGAKATLNMVTLNDLPQGLGRYPNATDAAGGFLSYETFSGATSITDNQLTTATNWVGAEVVVRKKLWVLDRGKITAHSGGTLTFTNANNSTYTGTNNYGYFIQNDARTLDRPGEWYFKSSTKYLQMYFGTALPSSYTVKVSTLDTLVTLTSKSYINFNNIVFEGANGNAMYASGGGYINIQNCDFSNEGIGAISMQTVANLLIENCNIRNVLSNAIIVNSGKQSNITIRGCNVSNTATIPGMGQGNGNSYKAIVAFALSNLLIEYNNVDTTGYVAIEFQGNNVTIKNNVVNHFDFVKDDAGGIYTYSASTEAAPGTIYTNRLITGNIVMNGMGAPNGRPAGGSLFATGIYLDGRAMNTTVTNNTVFNNPRGGIHSNNSLNVTIRNNTSYNNQNAVSVTRWSGNSVSGLTIKNNILYPRTATQKTLHYTNSALNEPVTTTVQAALTNLGNIDSNTCSMINPTAFTSEVYASTGGAWIQTSPLSLEGWRSYTTHDMNGKKPAKLPVGYKLTGLVGGNKFTNGLFNTAISGLTVFGSSVLGSWDNTGKISGGSLKISFSNPVANKYGMVHAAIGAVSSAKKYVLRFSTYGTTQQGVVRAYIRKTTSPNNNLVPTQVKTFGIGRKDHEFLFNAPTTDAGGSFVIELEQNSGVTYLDNIEFYEATATLYDTASQIRFEYNADRTSKTISLDGNYTAVDGTTYTGGTLTLQPFTSVILVKDTGSTTTPPVTPTTLRPTATAPAVTCYGSSTTVTVAATGGTAPYTGTGTFAATVGKGSLKLSFPTSIAGYYALLYYTIGGISSTKNYVLRFTTLGTTSAGKLRASIRQTGTPYTVLTPKQSASFGTSRQDHQFIFTAPASQTAASFLIEIDQSSGTTYIDNIAFFEADADGTLRSANLVADSQLETNISKVFVYSSNGNHVAAWDNTGKIASTNYYVVKDAANTTTVASVTIAQPAAPLTVSATAGLITILNGLTNVVVTAAGGTAPYTGTGNFSVLAGSYTYTVTDAAGCTAVTTVSVLPFSARPAVSAAPSVVDSATVAANTPAVAKEAGSKIGAKTLPSVRLNAIRELHASVYPNPAVDLFNIALEGGDGTRLKILVYSMDGKLVHQAVGNSDSNYSFGASFMPGVYIVKVMQGANTQTLKIIKAGN